MATLNTGVMAAGVLAAMAGVAPGQCETGWIPQGTNGAVRAACTWDPDGAGPLGQRVVVGGAFSRAMHLVTRGVAALDPSTGAWTPMGMGVGAASGFVPSVNAVAAGADGALYVAGQFSTAGGVPVSNIAKWDETTKTWSALGSGLDGAAYSLHVMPDGDVIAGGDFGGAGGQAAQSLARWDAQTQTWGPMASSVDNTVRAITSLPDGDVVIGGWITQVGEALVSSVVRWDAQTNTWGDLGGGVSDGNFTVYDLETLPDGDVVAAGEFATAGGVAAPGLARWDAATNTWSSVGGGITGGFGAAYAVARAADGDLIVVGEFTRAGTVTVDDAARWDAATNTWSGVSNVGGGGYAVAALGDGRAVLGGTFRSNPSTLPRYDYVATLDAGSSAAVAPTPRIVSGNIADAVMGPWGDVYIAPYNPVFNGARLLRRSAVTRGYEFLSSLTSTGASPNLLGIAGDESVLWLRTPAWVLEITNPGRGEQIGSWVWPTENDAAFTRMRNGDVLVAGWGVRTIDGVAVNGMARWSPVTRTWSAFAPEGNPNATGVFNVILEAEDGDVWGILGLGFARTIWRWDAATGVWTQMIHGVTGTDYFIANAPDGDIVIAGDLNDGARTRYVTRWDRQTGVWQRYPNLSTSSPSGIRGLHVTPDGGVIVCVPTGVALVSGYNATTQSWDPLVVGGGATIKSVSMPNGDFDFANLGDRWVHTRVPWIVEQPRTTTVVEGEAVVLRASPSDGYTGATVRWQRNGVDIVNGAGGASAGGGVVSGASGALPIPTDNSVAELVITGAQLSDAGVYRAIVTCPCGSVTTTEATVTVEADPCPCPADTDCSGGVDSDDVIVYFAAWDQSEASADFNGDGGVDSDDVIAFFARWDAGC